jgi:hypothetical protein
MQPRVEGGLTRKRTKKNYSSSTSNSTSRELILP